MKPADALLSSYARTRDLRDRIKSARNGCLCERHEGVHEVDGALETQSGEPCWKAARKWDDGTEQDGHGNRGGFHFHPPIGEWCQSCRNRQAYTEQLRAAVREHAAAKRAILQRGRALIRRSDASRIAQRLDGIERSYH